VFRPSIFLLALAPVLACAQSTCSGVNFLAARIVNLKPTTTSHIDVVRQADGSYTGYEVADAPSFRLLAATPHFEKQFAACLPHTLPASPATTAPAANPPGVESQPQVSTSFPSGDYFVATVSSDNLTISFTLFDSAHNLLSQSTFTPPSNTSVSNQNQALYSLSLADVNRDGNLDLIAPFESPISGSGGYNTGVWVFLGNGDGTFQAGKSQVLTTGFPVTALSVTIGDLNGDGKPDLALGAGNPSRFTIALGNGDGTFNAQVSPLSLPSTFSGSYVSAAIADLNGDGKADLVLSAYANSSALSTIAAALGNGDGTFQAFATYPVLNSYAGISTASVAVGDVNGDGIPDIVTASGSILFGDGKGGFPSRKDYASSAVGSVMLGDFDGDGITDIMIGNGNPDFLSGTAPFALYPIFGTSDPSLTVLFGAGGGSFVSAPVSDIGGGDALAAADFNGDGIPDLAVSNAAAQAVDILIGNGNGEFSASTQLATGGLPVTVIAADFNHDGKQDIAELLNYTATQGSEVQIFLGNGNGTFSAPLTLPVSAAQVNFIAAPDVNGDGIPDLVVTSLGSLTVWLGKGDGTFSAPTFSQNGNDPTVAFGDFNGDGKLDLAVTYLGATTVTILLGHGDGTFPNSVSSPLPAAASAGPNNLVAADFTGDGILDLAVVSSHYTEIAVLTGQGNGAFSAPQLSPANALSIYAVDVNGDKLTDLIAIPAVTGPITALLGNGDGTFQPPAIIVSLPLGSPAIADLNRDGTPDLALVGEGSGVAAFLNLSHPSSPLTVVSAASFAPGPLTPNSIASAFGVGMISGGSGQLSVTIEDSADATRPATLFYSSDSQINFLVPAGTATGAATITVTTASGKQLTAQIQIAALAPALFTEGSSGLAAAYAVYVAPGGAQTVEPVFTVESGTVTPAPINVSQPGQTYLILFGTGFDTANATGTTASVQGVNTQVTYAGPQPTFAGLDQINLLLPPSLAGAGVVNVFVSLRGQTTNPVLVTIQ
jgi:uncharacterized protein (TIGR03437 family)